MPPKVNRKDKKETEAIVLDYLPYGFDDDKRPINQREPIIIAIGTEQFKLLELIGKKDRPVKLQDTVYVGDGTRPVVERIKRRMSYGDLTPTAKGELESSIEKIVANNEPRFVMFYNTAVYYSQTKHMLHLLPGFKTPKVVDTVAARQKKQFANFADISARVKSLKNPATPISKRILLELKNPEKIHLFTARTPHSLKITTTGDPSDVPKFSVKPPVKKRKTTKSKPKKAKKQST